MIKKPRCLNNKGIQSLISFPGEWRFEAAGRLHEGKVESQGKHHAHAETPGYSLFRAIKIVTLPF